MSLIACAEIVRKGDPDRFLAAMAAPPGAREKLFPIYAFNVEVARAPWVTHEPLIAEMRLQWWRAALDEIASGGPVRSHEVTTPLAGVLSPGAAESLVDVVEARKWDIGREGFADIAALVGHIERSSGRLTQVAATMLGDCDAGVARDLGTASGIAAWLRAVPALEASGRRPLPPVPEAVAELAEAGLTRLSMARSARNRVSRDAAAALLVGWETGPELRAARRRPDAVRLGGLKRSEFRRRLNLLVRGLSGRW